MYKISLLPWFFWQYIILLLICLSVGLIFGKIACYSSIAGTLLATIPHMFFGIKLFQYQGAKYTKKILNNFYWGETLKICMTIVGFIAIFSLLKTLYPVFLLGLFIIAKFLNNYMPLFKRLEKY